MLIDRIGLNLGLSSNIEVVDYQNMCWQGGKCRWRIVKKKEKALHSHNSTEKPELGEAYPMGEGELGPQLH